MDSGVDHKDHDQSKQIHQAPLVVTEVATNGLGHMHRGSRRLSERDLLSQLRTWLLEEYVAPYCRALASTRIFRHCYWIDALDGATRAQLTITPIENSNSSTTSTNGHRRKKGTPQALHEYPPILQPTIKLSRELALEGRPIALHSLFLTDGSSSTKRRGESHARKDVANDPDPHLEAPLLLPNESAVLPQSWLESAAQILPAIEQSPAIFLLNPLAPILFTENDLTPLHRRATPTELCLFLSHKQILIHLQAASTSQILAGTLTALLRTDRWKTLVSADKGSSHAYPELYGDSVAGFIELLSASLKRHFTFPVHAIPIPVLVGPATVENAPYTLLFATKRQDSLFSMNDAMCRYQRRLEEESYRGVLGEEWFRTQQQNHYDQARQQLTQRILSQGRSQRTRRWPDLRQQVLLTHFGQFLIQDYDATMQQFLLSGEVSCAWRKASQIEVTGGQAPSQPLAHLPRVPGNEDTLTWHL